MNSSYYANNTVLTHIAHLLNNDHRYSTITCNISSLVIDFYLVTCHSVTKHGRQWSSWLLTCVCLTWFLPDRKYFALLLNYINTYSNYLNTISICLEFRQVQYVMDQLSYYTDLFAVGRTLIQLVVFIWHSWTSQKSWFDPIYLLSIAY